MRQNGSSSWYLSIPDISLNLPSDLSQVPDVFLNVMTHSFGRSSRRVGFVRLKVIIPTCLTRGDRLS